MAKERENINGMAKEPVANSDQLPEVINIQPMIRIIRERQVMLDSDLSALYGVETRRLNEQVKRNMERFPDDFMFQLNKDELDNLMSQNATSSWGGTRKLPYAFTEQGIAMLSSVLKSKTAVEVNIRIMRAFISMRRCEPMHHRFPAPVHRNQAEKPADYPHLHRFFWHKQDLEHVPRQ